MHQNVLQYGVFFWPCVKCGDLWETCDYEVCIPVKLVLLLNTERVFELLKRPTPKPTQCTVLQQTVNSDYEFECFDFCLFWDVGLFFFFLGSAVLLLTEKSCLYLHAPNWEWPVTVVLARLVNQTLHMQDTIKVCVFFCFILLCANTCAMEWWSCSDTAQAWAWVSQRRIWGVSWLSGQSISLLTTAAAAVSKRKSMPIVMSYPWESVVIALCPGCQEQHSSSVLSASLQMWFLTRSSWRGRKMLLLKHVLTLAAIKTFLQCPAVALGGGVKNYSHQQVHLQIPL